MTVVSGTAAHLMLYLKLSPTHQTIQILSLTTFDEEEFDYTLIGMDTQPRATSSEWIDNGAKPLEILREMGDPILIEDESHENHDDISSNQSETSSNNESDYEKRKANEQERPDLLAHTAPNQN
jgi:hypothetical protein